MGLHGDGPIAEPLLEGVEDQGPAESQFEFELPQTDALAVLDRQNEEGVPRRFEQFVGMSDDEIVTYCENAYLDSIIYGMFECSGVGKVAGYVGLPSHNFSGHSKKVQLDMAFDIQNGPVSLEMIACAIGRDSLLGCSDALSAQLTAWGEMHDRANGLSNLIGFDKEPNYDNRRADWLSGKRKILEGRREAIEGAQALLKIANERGCLYLDDGGRTRDEKYAKIRQERVARLASYREIDLVRHCQEFIIRWLRTSEFTELSGDKEAYSAQLEEWIEHYDLGYTPEELGVNIEGRRWSLRKGVKSVTVGDQQLEARYLT